MHQKLVNHLNKYVIIVIEQVKKLGFYEILGVYDSSVNGSQTCSSNSKRLACTLHC